MKATSGVISVISIFSIQYPVSKKLNIFRLSISLMKISAGMSDVKFNGKVRCVLHLVDVLPLVGSVEVMFLQAPGLDFDLHGAANFLDLPGLHGMIRSVVAEAIKTQLVYPNKITFLTREGDLTCQMLLPKPVGVIRLTIIEAANLPETDFGGLFRIDPYCHVQVSMCYYVRSLSNIF